MLHLHPFVCAHNREGLEGTVNRGIIVLVFLATNVINGLTL